MAKADELVVITQTYDLILWSCQHTSPLGNQPLGSSVVSRLRFSARRPHAAQKPDRLHAIRLAMLRPVLAAVGAYP